MRRLLPLFLLVAGIYTAWPEQESDAATPQDALSVACNQRVTAFPSRFYNPDAGTGLVPSCIQATTTGYTTVNVESESSTPVYLCWRTGTRGGGATSLGIGNIADVCRKRCVGCNNGSAYQAVVNNSRDNLFVLFASTNDAGPAEIAATDGGAVAPQVRVELGR